MKTHAFLLAVVASLATTVVASPTGTSIAINFAADEPEGAALAEVEGAAGVLQTVNWNNFELSVGGPEDLFADVSGTITNVNTTVEWISNNTWSSDGRGNEDLNDAEEDTNDRALMLGYLDTNADVPAQVFIEGLGSEFTSSGYDVYVYILGGVIGRGGDYTIGDTTIEHDVLDFFEGDYEEGPEGNYLLFTGLTDESFTLDAQPARGATRRAPINAIEIVASGVAADPGDFDGNGILDAADIDALTAEVKAGTNNASFDLNKDGSVNQEDRRVWVEDIRNTYFGDSNLDGEFSSSDFVTVFVPGEYEDGVEGNSTWASGDWNGDCEFSSSDFVAAFQGQGYEQGPRQGAAAQAVPEPATGILAVVVLALIGTIRGRK